MMRSVVQKAMGSYSCWPRRPTTCATTFAGRPPRQRLVGRDFFQSRANTPFDRRLVLLIIALIHHDGLQVHFLRRRLLAQIADGDLGPEAALNESIVVAATEDITGLDEVDHL